MTIYDGWEHQIKTATVTDMTVNGLNVGKSIKRADPSAKAKTVKIGMKFNGPYEYLDTSAGEMRQTMPTFSRDEIRLQSGLLKHTKLQQKIANAPLSRLRSLINKIFTYL